MVLKPLSMLMLAQEVSATSQRLAEALGLMVVGMLVVFTALSLTALAIIVINRLDRWGTPPDLGPHATATKTNQPDRHLIVVLAAAAATTIMGKEIRIRSIEPAE